LGLVAPDAAARGIVLDASVTPADWSVRADPQRLRQVLLNLLSNAVKFNRLQGRVEVRARVEGEHIRILVADQGPGLSEAQVQRLFTPFERLGAERSAVEGTGLGLALSKRLIEAMGGSIGVDSDHAGACFWIALPRAPASAPTLLDTPLPTSAPAETTRRILSVEDNVSNQALIRTLCERRPHWQLTEASSLAEAEAALRTARPDLILLDLHLSDGNGEDLLHRLHALPSNEVPPVVAISADAIPATLERVRALGVRAYLTKPLDVAAFYRVLDEVLA
jgi:CheY-like chemotaxis protein